MPYFHVINGHYSIMFIAQQLLRLGSCSWPSGLPDKPKWSLATLDKINFSHMYTSNIQRYKQTYVFFQSLLCAIKNIVQVKVLRIIIMLTLILPITRYDQYAITTYDTYSNSLDPEEMQRYSESHPGQSCLTLGQHLHQLWATFKQNRN